jgi:alcohol dehydrogenase class IV
MIAEIQIPPILKIGGGAFLEVPSVLGCLHAAGVLIVTDPFLASQGLPDRLRDLIRASGRHCEIFSETVADPTSEIVEAGVRAFIAGENDALVSLGGGSPIDTAKAIGMLATNGGHPRDYKVPHTIPNAGPVHIAIPTTAGTGSEVTRFTVITDSERDEKMLIAGGALLPSAALVDYQLTLSMPPRLTADTGTDALTHAIEAYVSRKANRFTDTMALSAMKIIWTELPRAFNEPQNETAREAIMFAATLAGVAFSNASVALVHGMSRPIGAFFHVPHGLSNAMLLPAVTAFSVHGHEERYADCARAMGIVSAADSARVAGGKLVEALYRRNEELHVPSPHDYGIDKDRYFAAIPLMSAQALASGSPHNNPRIPSAEEIEQLYRQVWA